MSTQNVQTLAGRIKEYADTVWNEGDIDAADEYFADDVVVHEVPNQTDYENLDEFKQWVIDVRKAFPDLTVETTSVIAGDEQIASQWVTSGTHKGEMVHLDIEPTNKTVTWEGVTVYTVEGEKVTEAWWYYDTAGMMAQLGVLPE